MKKKIEQIAEAYGWFKVHSKNPYMISFKQEEDPTVRINFYFTTRTVTAQKEGRGMITKKFCEVHDFEDLLIKLQKQ